MFLKRKDGQTSYGIVGLGRFGFALAMDLAGSGGEVIALDREEEKVREIREVTENAFVIPTLDKKSLEETGIQNCDVAVVCIGEEMDVSILTTLNLVSMGIPRVIAKAASPEHGLILEKLGAEVVYPERDMALRLASRLETDRVLDIIQLSEQLNISKVLAPAPILGKTVLEINLRSRFGLNIIAIENDGQVKQAIRPEDCFLAGDILYLIGDKEGLIEFNRWVQGK